MSIRSAAKGRFHEHLAGRLPELTELPELHRFYLSKQNNHFIKGVAISKIFKMLFLYFLAMFYIKNVYKQAIDFGFIKKYFYLQK